MTKPWPNEVVLSEHLWIHLVQNSEKIVKHRGDKIENPWKKHLPIGENLEAKQVQKFARPAKNCAAQRWQFVKTPGDKQLVPEGKKQVENCEKLLKK